jgi:hypothetical protein
MIVRQKNWVKNASTQTHFTAFEFRDELEIL